MGTKRGWVQEKDGDGEKVGQTKVGTNKQIGDEQCEDRQIGWERKDREVEQSETVAG